MDYFEEKPIIQEKVAPVRNNEIYFTKRNTEQVKDDKDEIKCTPFNESSKNAIKSEPHVSHTETLKKKLLDVMDIKNQLTDGDENEVEWEKRDDNKQDIKEDEISVEKDERHDDDDVNEDNDDDNEDDDDDDNGNVDEFIAMEEGGENEEDEESEESDSDESEEDGKSKRLYWCKFCWKDFRYINHVRRHIKRIHRPEKPSQYQCIPCNVKIYSGKKFTEHFKKCEYGYLQKKIFKCSNCEKNFPLRLSYIHHKKTCGVKSVRFPCSLCERSFKLVRSLNHHLRMHTELQSRCKVCGRPFSKAMDLKRHMMTHENKIPYFCNKCKIGFTEKNQFKKHKKTHKNKKLPGCSKSASWYALNY